MQQWSYRIGNRLSIDDQNDRNIDCFRHFSTTSLASLGSIKHSHDPFNNGNINIHSNAATDGDTQAAPNVPDVSIFSAAGSTISQPVVYHNVELVNVAPHDATEEINILGDDNGQNVGQQDEILIIGRDVDSTIATGPIAHPSDADGANEFSLLINGSTPINAYNVAYLNIFGADGDDDITLDPFADDTVGGWAIDVAVDGGLGDDDIFYGNIERDTALQSSIIFIDDAPDGSLSGVSEDIVIAPQTTTGAGQIAVTNNTDDSNIVTVDFTTIEDISVFVNDGSAGDTDTLTVLGTISGDVMTVNLANAGNDTEPLIDIDSITGTQLLQVENIQVATSNTGAIPTLAPLAQLGISTGNGDDTISVVGRTDGATTINIPGAPSSMMTALDGYPMQQQGKGALALGHAPSKNDELSIVAGVRQFFVERPGAHGQCCRQDQGGDGPAPQRRRQRLVRPFGQTGNGRGNTRLGAALCLLSPSGGWMCYR